MSENRHFVGYVYEIVGDRRTLNNNHEFKFRMVVDHGKKIDGEWVPNKTFYTVVSYNHLARNIMATFARQSKAGVGLRLIVIGRKRNDTFTASGGYDVPRQSIVANYAGPDLNWNIAAVVPMGPDTTDDAIATDATAHEQVKTAA